MTFGLTGDWAFQDKFESIEFKGRPMRKMVVIFLMALFPSTSFWQGKELLKYLNHYTSDHPSDTKAPTRSRRR